MRMQQGTHLGYWHYAVGKAGGSSFRFGLGWAGWASFRFGMGWARWASFRFRTNSVGVVWVQDGLVRHRLRQLSCWGSNGAVTWQTRGARHELGMACEVGGWFQGAGAHLGAFAFAFGVDGGGGGCVLDAGCWGLNPACLAP